MESNYPPCPVTFLFLFLSFPFFLGEIANISTIIRQGFFLSLPVSFPPCIHVHFCMY